MQKESDKEQRNSTLLGRVSFKKAHMAKNTTTLEEQRQIISEKIQSKVKPKMDENLDNCNKLFNLDLGTDFRTAKDKLEKLRAERKQKNCNVTFKVDGENLGKNIGQSINNQSLDSANQNPFGASKNSTFFTDTSQDKTCENISKIMDQSKLLEITQDDIIDEEQSYSQANLNDSQEQNEDEKEKEMNQLLEYKMAGHTCMHDFLKESSFLKSMASQSFQMSTSNFCYGFQERPTDIMKENATILLEPVEEIEDPFDFEIESPKFNPQIGNIQLEFI